MSLIIKNKGIGYFNSYILQRIVKNKNFIACLTGATGSGKSWSMLREGEILDPDFSVDNICFTAQQFMDLVNGKIKKLNKGSFIGFDEIQVSMSHLDYQSLQARLLNYVLQTFRHRNFILFMTSPHFNFINASARKLFHSRMETVSIDYQTGMCKLKPFLLQVNQSTGDVYQKYLRVYTKDHGIVPLKSLKVSKPSKELIKAYEQKKTEFTNQLNESIIRDLQILEGKNKPKKTYKQECLKCEYTWYSPKEKPLKCPSCQHRNIKPLYISDNKNTTTTENEKGIS